MNFHPRNRALSSTAVDLSHRSNAEQADKSASKQRRPITGRDGANHTLGHIDPQRLGRRVVVFTPTGDEIDFLVNRAREDLPELGTNEVVHRVVSHNPDSLWAIARRENFNSRARTPEGFQAYLMLNREGVRRLIDGTLNGSNPDLSLIARQNEKPAGIYIWCTHAWGALSGGMSLTLQKISTPLYRDVDVYSCASTFEGQRTLEGLGFSVPATFDGISSDR